MAIFNKFYVPVATFWATLGKMVYFLFKYLVALPHNELLGTDKTKVIVKTMEKKKKELPTIASYNRECKTKSTSVVLKFEHFLRLSKST